MAYLVAVSGGVDSVVLLDVMAAQATEPLIVAHVDHGIRGEASAADARFVAALAARYGLPFVSAQLKLGPNASEATAREVRYDFLLDTAAQYQAPVVTAHHLDDLVETVALNLVRGTGWRGLAVLNRPGVERPLLGWRKADIRAYALAHRLEWVEDETNASDRYTRNRLRRCIQRLLTAEQAAQITSLRDRQLALRHMINDEVQHLLPQFAAERHRLIMIDEASAQELLGAMIMWAGAPRPTRPRLERAVLAIKTARPGSRHVVGDGVYLQFGPRQFTVEVVQ